MQRGRAACGDGLRGLSGARGDVATSGRGGAVECGAGWWVVTLGPIQALVQALYGGDDGARTRDLCRDSYAN
jgi:hypothetical protein